MPMRTSLVVALSFVIASGLASGCGSEGKKKSMERYNAGATALGQKQYETAIDEFEESTKAWGDNHKAWYGSGQAKGAKGDWKAAADDFTQAVKLKDDDAM